jgi:imidazole glycerol phosphate synthase glutamine amidotransferase subunit
MKLVIINYGAGNIKSIQFAFKRLGVDAILSDDRDEIIKADKVIFPGVGEASSAMKKLKESGLDAVIPNLKQPVLGICLGMQLMCLSPYDKWGQQDLPEPIKYPDHNHFEWKLTQESYHFLHLWSINALAHG